MLLLHVSDTHLGSSEPITHSREREYDFYEVFDEVIDIAIRERVDAVIHCGDLFDSPDPSPKTYYYAVRSLKKLSEAGIPLLVIAGQHDQPKRAEVSPLKVLEEVGVARVLALSKPESHAVRLRGGVLGVTAVPYAPPDVFRGWTGGLKKVEADRRILMAHLILRELGLPGSHVSLVELDVAGLNYVALGDYHKRYATDRGGTPIVYPGSTEALRVDERSDERYVALVDLSSRNAIVSWIRLSRFRRIVVLEGVGSYSELVKALDRLGRGGKPPILYVKLSEQRALSGLDAERVGKTLKELVGSRVILGYRIVTPGVAEVEEESPEAESGEPPPTLDYVVYEVAKDPEVAELLIKIIRMSDDEEAVKRLVYELVGNDRLLGKLERTVVRK